MPTINDATVVNSAYDTSGNGGRKLVRLNNGWLIAVTTGTTPSVQVHLYKSTDNGATFTQLCFAELSGATIQGVSILNVGNRVFVLLSYLNGTVRFWNIDATIQTNIDIFSLGQNIDISQTALNGNSLAINDAGTELNATWVSKNATYPNSFNIRYAKGTINGDGSVTWGAVEQVTTFNTSGIDFINPSIVIKNNYAYIFIEEVANKRIMFVTNAPLTGTYSNIKTGWAGLILYSGGSYTQSSPSAIFVPQSINGLANGRIWVAWHGYDSTDTNAYNIRVSYSDDGGVTWSSMTKLTSGNSLGQTTPSITADKNNNVYVLWDRITAASTVYVGLIKYSSGAWGSISNATTASTTTFSYPSALFDLSISSTLPLFIYKGSAKVGFYGTWTVITISVTQGDIGAKTDKTNLLTYAITTDGTISTITESINGTVVNTHVAPANAQPFIVGLTQAQWDAIKYGKYKDATGGKNTLTVTMGTDTFTYTFDKRLATGDDILSAVKATQDTQTTYLPSVKSQLASAIRGKGGTVNDADAFDTMVSALNNVVSGRKASGSATVDGSGNLTVTGLAFIPNTIYIAKTASKQSYFAIATKDIGTRLIGYNNTSATSSDTGITFNSNGFSINGMIYLNGSCTWWAIE